VMSHESDVADVFSKHLVDIRNVAFPMKRSDAETFLFYFMETKERMFLSVQDYLLLWILLARKQT